MSNGVATVENGMAVPQKVKTQTYYMIQQSHFWAYLPKRIESRAQTHACTAMFRAALVTVAKRWTQPICPLPDEGLNKMWSICATACYSALKRNEILTHAMAQINHGCWVKDARHKRTNVVWFYLHQVPKVGKFRDRK